MGVDNYEIIEVMKRFGGSFVQALAEAWLKADPVNRQKIKDTWPEYWSRYTEMAEREKAART